MPFHVLISSDIEVSLMSMHVFLTMQIPTSSLILTSPVRGPSGDVVETHGSIVLPVALRVTHDFQNFLVNFFIVGLMLPYAAIITWGRAKLCGCLHHRADYRLPRQC
jgi:hypothetical protein